MALVCQKRNTSLPSLRLDGARSVCAWQGGVDAGNPSFGVEEHDDVKDPITILSLSVVLSFVVDLRGSPSGGSGAFILLHKHTLQVGEFGVSLTMPR